jgi:hypothetical protein
VANLEPTPDLLEDDCKKNYDDAGLAEILDLDLMKKREETPEGITLTRW